MKAEHVQRPIEKMRDLIKKLFSDKLFPNTMHAEESSSADMLCHTIFTELDKWCQAKLQEYERTFQTLVGEVAGRPWRRAYTARPSLFSAPR
eukprot:5692185-Pleurochrysis_carterae.AAC.1